MDMWNWILDCYNEGSITWEELENIMNDDDAAEELWKDFALDSGDFIPWVKEQVEGFLKHMKKRKIND